MKLEIELNEEEAELLETARQLKRILSVLKKHDKTLIKEAAEHVESAICDLISELGTSALPRALE